MILLDTNVISELMKASPAPVVVMWLDQRPPEDLFISTITIAEISYGINALPAGRRQRLLEDAFSKTIQETFKHRILAFDEPAAHLYGNIMSDQKKLGKPMSILDGQLAAIARSHQACVATRNVRDFSHCEVKVINPFETTELLAMPETADIDLL